MESAGEILRRARTAAGLTQEQLAIRASVKQESISNIESTRHQVDHVTVGGLAVGLWGYRVAGREIEQWWSEHAGGTVNAIAGRRERYRRARAYVAQRVRDAPGEPAGYVTELIGERPSSATDDWDHAAAASRRMSRNIQRLGSDRSPRRRTPAAPNAVHGNGCAAQ